jgi:hypothetical protein
MQLGGKTNFWTKFHILPKTLGKYRVENACTYLQVLEVVGIYNATGLFFSDNAKKNLGVSPT